MLISFPLIGGLEWWFGCWVVSQLPSAKPGVQIQIQTTNPNHRPDGNRMAMGQNPNRTPSEHPNPTTKIGSKMGGEFTNPNQNGISQNGFDPATTQLSGRRRKIKQPTCSPGRHWSCSARCAWRERNTGKMAAPLLLIQSKLETEKKKLNIIIIIII